MLPILGAAVAVYSLWLIPQLIGLMDLGGYVNLTFVGTVNLTALGVLGGWGITTPLAAYGAFRRAGAMRTDPGLRVAAVLVGVGAALVIASSAVPALLGEGFETLGRSHRYWPLLHLGIAILAAMGLVDLLMRVSARTRAAAVGLALVVMAAAITSPIVASIAYSRAHLPRPSGVITSATRGEPRALLNLIAPQTGLRCNIAVPTRIGSAAWSYTGYRLVLSKFGKRPHNFARIRWRDIYERIPGDKERLTANRVLLSGLDPEEWQTVVDRFDVDIIVTSPDYAEGPAMARFEAQMASEIPLAVVRIDSCD
jgi:hypothetical protein